MAPALRFVYRRFGFMVNYSMCAIMKISEGRASSELCNPIRLAFCLLTHLKTGAQKNIVLGPGIKPNLKMCSLCSIVVYVRLTSWMHPQWPQLGGHKFVGGANHPVVQLGVDALSGGRDGRWWRRGNGRRWLNGCGRHFVVVAICAKKFHGLQ